MPKGHREHLHWSPSRLIDWAAIIGPATAKLVANIMDQRSYPEQGYRSCSGIMRLAKLYPKDRVEAACQRALLIAAPVGFSQRRWLLSENDQPDGANGFDYFRRLGTLCL